MRIAYECYLSHFKQVCTLAFVEAEVRAESERTSLPAMMYIRVKRLFCGGFLKAGESRFYMTSNEDVRHCVKRFLIGVDLS